MTSTLSRGGVRFSDSQLGASTSVQVEAVNGDDTCRARRADAATAMRPRRPSPRLSWKLAPKWSCRKCLHDQHPAAVAVRSVGSLSGCSGLPVAYARSLQQFELVLQDRNTAVQQRFDRQGLRHENGLQGYAAGQSSPPGISKRQEDASAPESRGVPCLTCRSCGSAGQPSRVAHGNRHAGRRPGCRPSRLETSSCIVLMALLACLHMLLMRAATLAAAALA